MFYDVRMELSCDFSPAPGFKKWGGKKGATIDYGGANMCAYSEREARADFFELLGSDFFLANMCAERT